MTRVVVIVLILLAPLTAIAAAIYEIAIGKNEPTLYLLLVAIPGALLAALKELKDSGVLPPSRLTVEVNKIAQAKRWEQAIPGSDATCLVTDIVIPIRIQNNDATQAIDLLDVNVIPKDSAIRLQTPAMREVKIGSEKKWIYTLGDGGWSELFNDGRQKTIEATKINDYVIGLREYDTAHTPYAVQILFRDNWKRRYSADVTIHAP